MQGYKFVVCGRNTAWGIFDDMATALESLKMSCKDLKTKYPPSEEYASLTGTVKGEYVDFTIMAVKPSQSASKLF